MAVIKSSSDNIVSKYLLVVLSFLTSLVGFYLFQQGRPSSLILLFVSFLLLVAHLGVFRNLSKRFILVPQGIETHTLLSHDQVPLSEIIAITIQVSSRKTSPGIFDPVDILLMILTMFATTMSGNTLTFSYRVETELYIYSDTISGVLPEDCDAFIEELRSSLRVSPAVSNFNSLDDFGTLYYFSLRTVNQELDDDGSEWL